MTSDRHITENRRYWDGRAHDWVAAGEQSWALDQPVWGIWGVPEAELEMLPETMHGLNAVELGCGTGYVSAWMARRGATVTGIDLSEQQLATARRLAREHDVDVEFVHGNAEATPFAGGQFDFAVSEYGAAIWCDPYVWIPEAHRLLRPGGQLVFLGNHPLAAVCATEDGGSTGERLLRPYFDLHMQDWSEAEIDPGGIEFNLPVSAWFALFREVGFAVEDYREPRPAEPGAGKQFTQPAEWAYRFPGEQVWKLRKL